MGLNSGYENVKTTVLSMDPLPSINKALALQKIERQSQIADAVDILAEANEYVVGRQPDDFKPDFKKPRLEYVGSGGKKCSHCNASGHNTDEWFKLKDCSFCGKKVHVRDICFRLRNSTAGRYSGSKGRIHF
ncbi:hypothetical protein RND81_05G046100 [Saponaria officinalis]|uniref:Uncharacterized protein n=1 Tax=Saponaria officinalis TaxID=3572 RepID=A0AAW1KQC1_SAPOF